MHTACSFGTMYCMVIHESYHKNDQQFTEAHRTTVEVRSVLDSNVSISGVLLTKGKSLFMSISLFILLYNPRY